MVLEIELAMARAAFILFAFLCLLAGIFSSRVERGGDLSGRWEGTLLTVSGPEEIVLTLRGAGKEHAGSLEMRESTLELLGFHLHGDTVRLVLSDGATVQALVDGMDLVGALHQNGARHALTLHRIPPKTPALKKPWSIESTRLFRKLGQVQDLFERRQTSTPTAAIAPT